MCSVYGRNIIVRNSVMAVCWYLVTNQCPPALDDLLATWEKATWAFVESSSGLVLNSGRTCWPRGGCLMLPCRIICHLEVARAGYTHVIHLLVVDVHLHGGLCLTRRVHCFVHACSAVSPAPLLTLPMPSHSRKPRGCAHSRSDEEQEERRVSRGGRGRAVEELLYGGLVVEHALPDGGAFE